MTNKQDIDRVKYLLDTASVFYGYPSYDVFCRSDIDSKEEKGIEICRLAELLQNEINAAEMAVIESIDAPLQVSAALRNFKAAVFEGLRITQIVGWVAKNFK